MRLLDMEFLFYLIRSYSLQVSMCGTTLEQRLKTLILIISYHSLILNLHLLVLQSLKENMSCCLTIRTAKKSYLKFLRFYKTNIFQFGSKKEGISNIISTKGTQFKMICHFLNFLIDLFFFAS